MSSELLGCELPTYFNMAELYAWVTRCIPAFSIGLVIALSFFGLFASQFGGVGHAGHTVEATVLQLILAGYILFLHTLSVVYPLRVCYSIRDVTKRMKEASSETVTSQIGPGPDTKHVKESPQPQCPLFAIILPAYKEEVSTLEETLRVLAAHPQARESYHVSQLSMILARMVHEGRLRTC